MNLHDQYVPWVTMKNIKGQIMLLNSPRNPFRSPEEKTEATLQYYPSSCKCLLCGETEYERTKGVILGYCVECKNVMFSKGFDLYVTGGYLEKDLSDAYGGCSSILINLLITDWEQNPMRD